VYIQQEGRVADQRFDSLQGRVRTAWSRLRATFASGRMDRELDAELAVHLEMLTDDLRRAGLSEMEARREARRKLGRLDPLREDHRAERSLPTLDLLIQAVRHSTRRLARTPVFTVVVILILAIGIGANAALFSLVDSLLLRSLPVRDPDQLVWLRAFSQEPRAWNDKPLAEDFDRSTFAAVRAQAGIIEGVVGYRGIDRPAITIDGNAEPGRAVDWVSPNFFAGLGVSTILGRSADTADANVAVISARWWRSRFGGSSDVLGRELTIDGKTFTIIGVAPPRFHGFELDRSPDVFITPAPVDLRMIARLLPGVERAQAEAAVFHQLLAKVDPGDREPTNRVNALPVGNGLSDLRGRYKGALLALMGLVTLVLFTTCANVGNLVMLRNTARRRELAVRSALGAGRSRLVAHSLVETTLLATAGCVAGVLLARWGVSLVVAMLPLPAPPGSLAFHSDARLLIFASAICVFSTLLFGLGPAWRAADVNLTGWLQSTHGLSAPLRMRHFGRLLVSAQVALSVLLLVGAGLFVQTLRNLSRLHVGFSAERLIQLSIDTRYAGYKENEVPALSRLLLERISEVPGVRSASRTRNPLMRGTSGMWLGLLLPGIRKPVQDWDGIDVGPQFFETMGITVVRGRAFAPGDFAPERRTESRWVVDRFVINEAFVKQHYPNVDPLAAGSPIIGIVKDAKLFSVKDSVGPVMFLASPWPELFAAIQVRVAGDPVAIERAIRQVANDVNPRLLTEMSTLGEASSRSMARERMVASISGFFGVLGVVLAALGIFGIASSAVTQRTKELGIRRALGAGRWLLVRDSLRDTLVVISIGLTTGTLVALVIVRVTATFIADLLYGISATDMANLAVAVGMMLAVGLAACALPALRATRVDPLLSIRADT
jgi:predicted permease